jgi:hypothetical protein
MSIASATPDAIGIATPDAIGINSVVAANAASQIRVDEDRPLRHHPGNRKSHPKE